MGLDLNRFLPFVIQPSAQAHAQVALSIFDDLHGNLQLKLF